ncbi:MAG: hypothetical protein ACOY9J_04375 [Pseudomonadota bacterium]
MKAAILMALVAAFTLTTAQEKTTGDAADHAVHHPQTPAKQ